MKLLLRFKLTHFLLLTAFSYLLIPGLYAQTVFDAISSEVQAVFKKTLPSVVKVRAIDGPPLAGTGFYIDDQGTIITSYMGIRNARKAWVEFEDKKIEAEILGRDPRTNIAVLKVAKKNTPFLEKGDSHTLDIASGIISVAYPYNLPAAPSFGFVTGFNIRYLNSFFATEHIRANLKVSPGQLGGPILNSKGKLIGVLVMDVQGGNEGFIIPIESAMKIVTDIKHHGKALHGWVGVGVSQGAPNKDGARPVQVSHLYENTPALESGIQPGDIVIQIAEQKIKHPSDVLEAAFFSTVGKEIPVLVQRGDQQLTFNILVNTRPDNSNMVDPVFRIKRPNPDNILDKSAPQAFPVSAPSAP